MSKYIGWIMIALFVLPVVIGGFIAFPLEMSMAFGGTILAFYLMCFAGSLIEGKSYKEAHYEAKNFFTP